MRLPSLLILIILSTTSLPAQIFPAKYFEDAYFTNYHRQLLRPKLQKDFSTPIKVLQHLMAAKTVEDYTKIFGKRITNFEEVEQLKQTNFYVKNREKKHSAEIEFLIEFPYKNSMACIVSYHKYINGKAVNSKDLPSGLLTLIKRKNRWFLYQKPNSGDDYKESEFSRIKIFFGDIKADKLEFLITGKANKVDGNMNELKYYITSHRGINISKMTDLVLYWGIDKSERRLKQFFNWYPLRNFRGWDISNPMVKQWFDTRNRRALMNY